MSLVKRSSFPSLLEEFFNSDRFFDADFFKKDWVPAVNIAEKATNMRLSWLSPE